MIGPTAGLKRLLEVLNELGIPYMIGGSLASSVHGVYRATEDVDLVVDIDASNIDPLVNELGTEFYIDAEMIREALGRGRSCNVIHLASSYKFDLFPLSEDPFQQSQFERRGLEEFPQAGAVPMRLHVATAEDTVLSKLVWYRAGNEVSEQQWKDVRGVVAVKGENLDRDYMRRWAEHLGVRDLLDSLFAEA